MKLYEAFSEASNCVFRRMPCRVSHVLPRLGKLVQNQVSTLLEILRATVRIADQNGVPSTTTTSVPDEGTRVYVKC
eukprot:1997920-Rhodomonas_salina.1